MKRFLSVALAAIMTVIAIYASAFAEDEKVETWRSNFLPILYPIEVEVIDDDFLEEESTFEEAPDWVYEVLHTAEKEVQNFFMDFYSIDFTEKFDKLEKIYIFSSGEYYDTGLIVNAFVDEENRIKVNESILDDKEYLECNLVHELLHYLGFKDDEFQYIVEGLTEAVAEQVMLYADKEYFTSGIYAMPYFLVNQMLYASDECITELLTNESFSLSEYFNERLSGVKQVYGYVDNLAVELNACIGKCLEGQFYDEQEYDILVLQAQLIIIAFCRTYNPSELIINEIRKLYIYEDAEIFFEEPVYFVEEDPDFLGLLY